LHAADTKAAGDRKGLNNDPPALRGGGLPLGGNMKNKVEKLLGIKIPKCIWNIKKSEFIFSALLIRDRRNHAKLKVEQYKKDINWIPF
jgi:hypothetical protein